MAIWTYIPSDNHTIEHLEAVKSYYSTVATSMKRDLDRALSYQKYGLPNWRTEVIRRQIGLEEAYESLANVLEAIDAFNKEQEN